MYHHVRASSRHLWVVLTQSVDVFMMMRYMKDREELNLGNDLRPPDEALLVESFL